MADIKTKYGSSAALTITLASLASSTTRVAGRESTAIDNATNVYLDFLVSGKVTTGTSPTAGKTIEVWVYGSMNDTPDYPDVFDGTDSDETVTSENVKFSALKLAAVIVVDSNSDRAYPVAPFSVAALFGGQMPKKWGLFVVHDTGVALNATGSNHAFYYTPVYAQAV